MLQVHVASGSGSSSLLQGTNKKISPSRRDFFIGVQGVSNFQREVRSPAKGRREYAGRRQAMSAGAAKAVYAAASLLHKTQFCLSDTGTPSLRGGIFYWYPRGARTSRRHLERTRQCRREGSNRFTETIRRRAPLDSSLRCRFIQNDGRADKAHHHFAQTDKKVLFLNKNTCKRIKKNIYFAQFNMRCKNPCFYYLANRAERVHFTEGLVLFFINSFEVLTFC